MFSGGRPSHVQQVEEGKGMVGTAIVRGRTPVGWLSSLCIICFRFTRPPVAKSESLVLTSTLSTSAPVV